MNLTKSGPLGKITVNAGNTFSIEKIVRFFDGYEPMDRAYNWGPEWVPGRKE